MVDGKGQFGQKWEERARPRRARLCPEMKTAPSARDEAVCRRGWRGLWCGPAGGCATGAPSGRREEGTLDRGSPDQVAASRPRSPAMWRGDRRQEQHHRGPAQGKSRGSCCVRPWDWDPSHSATKPPPRGRRAPRSAAAARGPRWVWVPVARRPGTAPGTKRPRDLARVARWVSAARPNNRLPLGSVPRTNPCCAPDRQRCAEGPVRKPGSCGQAPQNKGLSPRTGRWRGHSPPRGRVPRKQVTIGPASNPARYCAAPAGAPICRIFYTAATAVSPMVSSHCDRSVRARRRHRDRLAWSDRRQQAAPGLERPLAR